MITVKDLKAYLKAEGVADSAPVLSTIVLGDDIAVELVEMDYRNGKLILRFNESCVDV